MSVDASTVLTKNETVTNTMTNSRSPLSNEGGNKRMPKSGEQQRSKEKIAMSPGKQSSAEVKKLGNSTETSKEGGKKLGKSVETSKEDGKKLQMVRPPLKVGSQSNINDAHSPAMRSEIGELIEVASDEVGRINTNVDHLSYFHGFLGKAECEMMLRNHGDFLVRRAEVGKTLHYVISIRWKKKNWHVLVKKTKTKKLYWTNTYAFKTICELIFYHKHNKVAIYRSMYLKCGLAKHIWQLNHEQIVLSEKLGEGQFGQVFKGTMKLTLFKSPKTVAVKTLHENHLTGAERILFLREATVMLTLDHPNVIKFYGVCIMRAPIMIVMEFCKGKSLEDALTSNEKISADEKLAYLYHAICGIHYLHNREIIHRDIAARNCLLTGYGVLRISDFGLSVKGTVMKEKKAGHLPVKYMAPETLKRGMYSVGSDVYSYGALIYEVYNDGKMPFDDSPLAGNELRKAIISQSVILEKPSSCPPAIAKIFGRSREHEPSQRCTTGEIIEIFKMEADVSTKDCTTFKNRTKLFYRECVEKFF